MSLEERIAKEIGLPLFVNFQGRMLSFMKQYDVMISPTNAYPGTVVRVGTSPEGLPIGVQIIGRPWGEHLTLRVAALLEKRFGGWQRPKEF